VGLRRRSVSTLTLVGIACLLAVRIAATTIVVPHGWAATYYANADFLGDPERSTEFRGDRWTRIDRRLDFVANTFPLHFLNELRFNFSPERHAPPFSAVYR